MIFSIIEKWLATPLGLRARRWWYIRPCPHADIGCDRLRGHPGFCGSYVNSMSDPHRRETYERHGGLL
jgi:hypothetical protein